MRQLLCWLLHGTDAMEPRVAARTGRTRHTRPQPSKVTVDMWRGNFPGLRIHPQAENNLELPAFLNGQ
jgi:hypothetical protein